MRLFYNIKIVCLRYIYIYVYKASPQFFHSCGDINWSGGKLNSLYKHSELVKNEYITIKVTHVNQLIVDSGI